MGKYKKTLTGFTRTDDQPLEENVVFATAAELTTYLQSNPTKYNGQTVIVKGDGAKTKGITYRIDQLGATWKAVPQADGEDVATKAQGGKADTAVQSATVGGVAVPKSGTTLQLPAYPTSLPASDKAAILTAAATDAQTKVNAHAGDTVKHITAGERLTWNAAIQAATVGGVAVPESGTTLQFPAYPTTLPASDKAAILTAAATDAQNKVNAAIKANITDKTGSANGLATLDTTGKVPAAQLPSYVDDVIELKGFDIPSSASGFVTDDLMYKTTDQKIYRFGGTSIGWIVQGAPESGKIYLSLQDSKIYRWSGSAMAVVSETLALGETSSTAYPGNKGAANAANITALQNDKLDKTGDGSNLTAAFTIATNRFYIATGEKLSVTFGKIAKWFGDLKALAFKDKVGTADITDRSVTLVKLDEETAYLIRKCEDYFVNIIFTIAIETGESRSSRSKIFDHGSAIYGELIKVSGIKKYVYISISGNHPGIDGVTTSPFIYDEAGNDITSLFDVYNSTGILVFSFTALTDIGMISINLQPRIAGTGGPVPKPEA